MMNTPCKLSSHIALDINLSVGGWICSALTNGTHAQNQALDCLPCTVPVHYLILSTSQKQSMAVNAYNKAGHPYFNWNVKAFVDNK